MDKLLFGCIFAIIICVIYAQITLPNQPVKDALFLHNTVTSNKTLKDCIFRNINDPNACPDPFIKHILYSGGKKEIVDYHQDGWLRNSIWDSNKEDIFIVHGYASGDDTLPIVVLRDAYLKNGSYNVWMIDWSPLSVPPCYRGAVHNLKTVAKCTGELYLSLKLSGAKSDRITCVGHSLGAHICGLIARAVSSKFYRIIGLDPARPLITPAIKLTVADALAVQVMHTNAGHYGERDKGGHVDFCLNGGRVQPFCENITIDAQLCSHVWAICYMAESLHPQKVRLAHPCSRRCPPPPRPFHKGGSSVVMGQPTPLYAAGSYCIHDPSTHPPYCPRYPNEIGDRRCCLDNFDIGPATTPIAEEVPPDFVTGL